MNTHIFTLITMTIIRGTPICPEKLLHVQPQSISYTQSSKSLSLKSVTSTAMQTSSQSPFQLSPMVEPTSFPRLSFTYLFSVSMYDCDAETTMWRQEKHVLRRSSQWRAQKQNQLGMFRGDSWMTRWDRWMTGTVMERRGLTGRQDVQLGNVGFFSEGCKAWELQGRLFPCPQPKMMVLRPGL